MQRTARMIDLENQILRDENRWLRSVLAANGLLEEALGSLPIPVGSEMIEPVRKASTASTLDLSAAAEVNVGIENADMSSLATEWTEAGSRVPSSYLASIGQVHVAQGPTRDPSAHPQTFLNRSSEAFFHDQRQPSPQYSTIPEQNGCTVPLPPTFQDYYPLTPANHHLVPASTTEMSCLKAAQILAELNGHSGTSKALADLGCRERSECQVRNTKIFELMNQS